MSEGETAWRGCKPNELSIQYTRKTSQEEDVSALVNHYKATNVKTQQLWISRAKEQEGVGGIGQKRVRGRGQEGTCKEGMQNHSGGPHL